MFIRTRLKCPDTVCRIFSRSHAPTGHKLQRGNAYRSLCCRQTVCYCDKRTALQNPFGFPWSIVDVHEEYSKLVTQNLVNLHCSFWSTLANRNPRCRFGITCDYRRRIRRDKSMQVGVSSRSSTARLVLVLASYVFPLFKYENIRILQLLPYYCYNVSRYNAEAPVYNNFKTVPVYTIITAQSLGVPWNEILYKIIMYLYIAGNSSSALICRRSIG